ncbi:c-_U-editing enzyme APOBEC-1-like protein [Willisornis vidua]|uniref:C->U-editing enzyme APOBEC-1-like protein n=1 Tax=Willisornis vidua TaxID=1566151 RepID=A0ABQ9DDG5_9PASS|nr:c->U-editing enzyme APOBEC-1-like protein [Willisornis vidua]
MYKEKKRGWHIPKEVLKEQFNPSEFPRETYLLCKIQWGDNGTPWIHWVKNYDDDHHAEVCFLEDVFLMKSNNVNCKITLYLSWSPCADCSCSILDFLKQHSNVTIGIYVARLYRVNSEENRKGLRRLDRSPQVDLRVMEMGGKCFVGLGKGELVDFVHG